MRNQRVWLEIALLGSAVALALALFLATVGLAAGVAESPTEPQQPHLQASEVAGTPAGQQFFVGMVTCSRCGAKHSPALSRPATVCVRVCVHGGASFALVEGDSTYLLDGNAEALKRVAGQRARVLGHLSGATIKVASINPEG